MKVKSNPARRTGLNESESLRDVVLYISGFGIGSGMTRGGVKEVSVGVIFVRRAGDLGVAIQTFFDYSVFFNDCLFVFEVIS